MQGLKGDTLASKRIPAASKMSSLPRLAAEYAEKAAGSNRDHPAATANDMAVKAASGAVPSVSTEQAHTYTGKMQMSGGFSDDISGATAKFSGSLKDTLYAFTDSAGNGSGYEVFSGFLTTTVTKSDGSVTSSKSAFGFYTPDFNIKRGHFTVSQQQNYAFELFLTLKLSGSLVGTRATISESLHSPFNGIVGNAIINGSLNGSSSLTTRPLTISGAASRQAATAAKKMTPFHNLVITDLNGTTVRATVTLSKPANGMLSSAAGGAYNRAKGTYTFAGSTAAVNHALRTLAFDPAGSKAGRVPTGFTLNITDAKGASLVNRTTSVIATNPLSIRGVSAHQSTTIAKAVTPFRYVTIGDMLGRETDTIKITLSKPGAGVLENLSGGHYNQKTGVYVLETNAATATSALRALKFEPTGSGTTSFTILVRNAAGASVTNGNTTVVASKASTAGTEVALFSQYVAAGLHGAAHHAAALPTPHELQPSAHFELAGAHR
jgi:hypothetical protein